MVAADNRCLFLLLAEDSHKHTTEQEDEEQGPPALRGKYDGHDNRHNQRARAGTRFFRLPAHGLNLSLLMIMRIDSFGHRRHFREVYYGRKKVTSERSRFRLPLSSPFRDYADAAQIPEIASERPNCRCSHEGKSARGGRRLN